MNDDVIDVATVSLRLALDWKSRRPRFHIIRTDDRAPTTFAQLDSARSDLLVELRPAKPVSEDSFLHGEQALQWPPDFVEIFVLHSPPVS